MCDPEKKKNTLTLREIYENERDFIWRNLRRLGVPHNDIEDIAHEVFVVIHRKLGDYDQNRPLKPWLFGILFRVSSQYFRKSKRIREQTFDDEELANPKLLIESETAETQLLQKQARQIVRRALVRLEENQRAVFILHEIEGVPIPAVAASFEIPVNTAYSRLRLARKQFNQEIESIIKSKGDVQ